VTLAIAAARHRPQAPLLAAVTAVGAWSLGPLMVRGISASSPTIVLWRVWLAVPVMVAVAHLTGGRLSLDVLRRAALPGLLFAASMGFSFASFQSTSIANATLIPSLLPALVLLVAGPLFGEVRSRHQVGLAAVAFGGVAVVVFGAGGSGGASLRGDLFAVVNLIVFTAYFLLAKRQRMAGVHAWAFIAAVFFVAAVAVTPWSLATADDLGAIGGTDWLLLLAMIVVPGLAGHGLMTWAAGELDVTVASLLTLGQPPFSALGAWVVYDQSLRPLQIAGAVVVLGALAGIVGHARSTTAPPAVVDPVEAL
jgi:drug/metabolite transporter (DMT)-like permease